jgi:hypothetical protein
VAQLPPEQEEQPPPVPLTLVGTPWLLVDME